MKYLRTLSLVKARIRLIWLLLVLISIFSQAEKACCQTDRTRSVLILNSYHQGLRSTDLMVSTITSALKSEIGDIDIHIEYFDSKRFNNVTLTELTFRFLKHKYESKKPDIIISTEENSLEFLKKYKHHIFSNTPVVFCGIGDKTKIELIDRQIYTGIVEVIDIQPTLELAFQLHPATKKAYIIADDSQSGQGDRQKVKDIEKHFPSMEFEYLTGRQYSNEELKSKLNELSSDSLVLLLIWMQDKLGTFMDVAHSVTFISNNSTVPVYGLTMGKLGYGIVGGKLMNAATHGEVSAQIALRILNGETPSSIPVITQSINHYMFDYKQLERWNIHESRLPEDSIVINKPVSFYSQYRSFVWITIGILIILIFLIIMLTIYIAFKKRMEKKLRESEERYRILFESSSNPFSITTPEGSFIEVNQAFLDLFEYSRDEIVNRLITTVYINPDERIDFKRSIDEKGLIKDFPVTLRAKSGRLIEALVTANIRRDNDGNILYYQACINDITNQKHLEAQFLQTQKMESVGRLAGGIAHDFNNLLTVIIGNSELAMTGLPETDCRFEDINEIKITAERAAQLTQQLLAFSRSQIIRPEIVNLNEILLDMDKMMRRLISENIEYSTIPYEQLWEVLVDRGQIEQVLTNLVVNASDAMPDGGSMMIETSNIVLDNKYTANQPNISPGDYVEIIVSDNGIGIEKENIPKLFEPFFTTKEKGKGTGLGLSTSYGIIKQSGGDIIINSEPGLGTSVKIFLPKAEGSINKKETTSGVDELHRGNETILVVEDEYSLRKMIYRILNDHGYNVIEAGHGEEALQLLSDYNDTVHLVITDVVMPLMGGRELVKEIEAQSRNVKVIYMSGYTEQLNVQNWIFKQDINYIEKPFTSEDLLKKVRFVLNS